MFLWKSWKIKVGCFLEAKLLSSESLHIILSYSFIKIPWIYLSSYHVIKQKELRFCQKHRETNIEVEHS